MRTLQHSGPRYKSGVFHQRSLWASTLLCLAISKVSLHLRALVPLRSIANVWVPRGRGYPCLFGWLFKWNDCC